MPRIEASTLVTFNPVCLLAGASRGEALELFCQWELREIPVVDRERRLLGVIELPQLFNELEADNDGLACPVASIRAVAAPFSLNQTPRGALVRLLSQGWQSVPVVDPQRLVGVIARNDYLREFSCAGGPLATAAVGQHCLPAGDGVEASATSEQAWDAMIAERRDYLAVIQDGIPVAACSRDGLHLTMLLAKARDLLRGQPLNHPRLLTDLLHPTPNLQPGQTLADAASLMLNGMATGLLVANKTGRILGVITEQLLLEFLLRDQS
jgi:CBS domain-containing protein